MLEPLDSFAHRLRPFPEEHGEPMPGDSLVDAPDWSEDYAIDIAATARQTWPCMIAATCSLAGWRPSRVAEPTALVLEARRTFVHVTWAFAIHDNACGSCRLHVRLRARYLGPGTLRPFARAAHAVASVTNAATEREMLEQIRERAELTAQREHVV
ncbi:MAG: hypothetical protein JO257_25110 [Deltaproteobacteria bacterium]|nr:hypothetical protein [Deltaproteobacteria bacterium]